jgi:cytochrome c peroxidase
MFALHSRLMAEPDDDTLGLPPISNPADNPLTLEKITLGQKLFFDKRLSRDGSTSCASCHQPEHSFADLLNVGKGIDGQRGSRNTPSLLNVAFNTTQFWDGRRSSLEEQALDPFLNPREHGLASEEALLMILRRDSEYRSAFQSAFPNSPDAISGKHVGQAIANFELTLVRGNSPFDRFAFLGEQSALSDRAQNGLALFQGRAQCARCHQIEKKYALFTDNEFHSLNVGLSRIEPRLASITMNLVSKRTAGASIDHVVLSDEEIAELGRFAVTLKPADIGKFRTPSLRNVARTGPYMHDGSVGSLEEAVELELYYRSTEAERPLILTPVEKGDLVEFLKSLSSPSDIASNVAKAIPHY